MERFKNYIEVDTNFSKVSQQKKVKKLLTCREIFVHELHILCKAISAKAMEAKRLINET